jgi:predicted nucleotidyltransferase component of viral defense system
MNIKAALQQRAKTLDMALPKLLQHYAMERFLYRLSLSSVADRFYLKGGMLLMGVGAGVARTTMDIDLLGRISNSPESIQKAIHTIIRTKPGVADGVSFSDQLEVQEITKDALYVGLRVSFSANVAGIACHMKVDIGFSDEVYPAALMLDYPATLSELPGPRLQCYSLESVIAEKWQAMVQLKQMNSRMKDFYDLWFLSRRYSFDYAILKEAVMRTFARRSTKVDEYISLKSEKYMKVQQPEWATYIRKLKAATFRQKDSVEIPPRIFADVMGEIHDWLGPVMENSCLSKWIPGKGWQSRQ